MLKDFLLLAWMKVLNEMNYHLISNYLIYFNSETIEKIGTTSVLKILNEELGGWPILSGNDYKYKFSLNEKQLILKKVEAAQWFEVFVSTNPKDPKHNILRLAQPSWFFNKEYILNQRIMNAYSQLMTNTIKFLNPLSSNFTDEIKAILELENRFAMVIQYFLFEKKIILI